MFILNVVIITLGLFLTKFISFNLLKNANTYYPLLACLFTLPFISIGYIIKGYFYGKQNTLPHMVSNVVEQLFRLLIISLFLPKLVNYGPVISITCYILFNILSESVSIMMFMFFLPKDKNITKDDIKLDYQEAKEILSISIPSVAGRLLGNVGFFLEPILLTNVLLYMKLPISYITQEYAVYNTYAIGTLLFPSFFISAICNALLPEISYNFERDDIKQVKKRIKQSLFFSLLIGVCCTMLIFVFKKSILDILYNTNKGINYIKILAPFFILFYLESPLSTILIGLNKVKQCTIISTTGIILKLVIMVILGIFDFKIYSLIIAEIINIIYVTMLNYICVRRALKK